MQHSTVDCWRSSACEPVLWRGGANDGTAAGQVPQIPPELSSTPDGEAQKPRRGVQWLLELHRSESSHARLGGHLGSLVKPRSEPFASAPARIRKTIEHKRTISALNRGSDVRTACKPITGREQQQLEASERNRARRKEASKRGFQSLEESKTCSLVHGR